MYAEHQPIIAAYARRGPVELWRVLRFVQATVNQRFYHVPEIIADLEQTGTSRFLAQHQVDAIATYYAERGEIYGGVFGESPLEYLVGLPRLGIVKGGFVCQLALGTHGCLDTHNLTRLGLDKRAFRLDGGAVRLRDRIRTYTAICASEGSAYLWDTWCDFLAARYPDRFPYGGDQVSAMHVGCIILKEGMGCS